MNGFECLYLDLDSDQDYSLPNIYFTNRNFVLAWVSRTVSVTLLLEKWSLFMILLVRDAADSSGWVSPASTSTLASSKSSCSI